MNNKHLPEIDEHEVQFPILYFLEHVALSFIVSHVEQQHIFNLYVVKTESVSMFRFTAVWFFSQMLPLLR